jgi:hypothetical protein
VNNALVDVIPNTMRVYGDAHYQWDAQAVLPIARLSYQHATTDASDVNIGGRADTRERLHAIDARQTSQTIFFRRRHQPSRPPLAKIRPGSPAPAMGPGTADTASTETSSR